MIAHTLAYGVQEYQFPQIDLIKQTLNECGVLKKAIIAVGDVPYAIRGLVAAPTIHRLPEQQHRRGATGQHPRAEADIAVTLDESESPPASTSSRTAQQASPTESCASSDPDDLFPFNVYLAPDPPSWSPPTTITAGGMYQLGLDVFIIADVVDEGNDNDSALSSSNNADGMQADMGDMDVCDTQNGQMMATDKEVEQIGDDVGMTDDGQHIPTPPFTPEVVRFRPIAPRELPPSHPPSSPLSGRSCSHPSLLVACTSTRRDFLVDQESLKSRNQAVYNLSNGHYSESPPSESSTASNTSNEIEDMPSGVPSRLDLSWQFKHIGKAHGARRRQRNHAPIINPVINRHNNDIQTTLFAPEVHSKSTQQAHTTPLSQFLNANSTALTIFGYGDDLDDYARASSITQSDVWIPSGLPTEVEYGHIRAWLEGHRDERNRQVHQASLSEEERVQEEIRKSQEWEEL